MRNGIVTLIVILLLSLGACSTLTPEQEAQAQVKRDAIVSTQYFQPLFQHAHVAYYPKKLALLVFKKSRVLQVYAQNSAHWVYINQFPIKAASGHAGPKLHVGDRQVPEGIYRITMLNPMSNFDLSMQINYPNAFDRRWAKVTGRHHLGDDIFIHGGHRSIGCVAIGNWAIQRLYPLVKKMGLSNVVVVIAPEDFRKNSTFSLPHAPQWLPILYTNIALELSRFPEPQVV